MQKPEVPNFLLRPNLAQRIHYALYGPGHSPNDEHWASIIDRTPDWQQPESPLLDLPAEIRNRIYEFLNDTNVKNIAPGKITPKNAPLRFLLRVCRQLFLETRRYPLNITMYEPYRTAPYHPILPKFTGLVAIRLVENASSDFGAWPYLHQEERSAFTVSIRQLVQILCEDVLSNVERVHMKLIFEAPPADVWKDPTARPTEDIERLKEGWEYEIDDLITIQMPESCVKIEFEYEMVKGGQIINPICSREEVAEGE